MVATAVVSFSTIMIYEALFKTMSAYEFYARYLTISPWMNEKIFAAQEALRRPETGPNIETSGEVTIRGQRFRWNIVNNPVPDVSGLIGIQLGVFTSTGQRQVRFVRDAYALVEQKQP